MNGLLVSNKFDTVLRRTNTTLWNGSAKLCQSTNGYDAASRLAVVSDGTNGATYSYLANSSLAGQIVFASNGVTRMTTLKQYDYLNRLSSITSTPSNSFAYLYNAANQRTMKETWDSSYWRYGYDALGQVISGDKYWVDETPVARPVRYEQLPLRLRFAQFDRRKVLCRNDAGFAPSIGRTSSGSCIINKVAGPLRVDLL